MQALFEVMESGGVGLFESPTGTGKTLSIVCAVEAWLREGGRTRSNGVEEDWVEEQVQERESRERAAERDKRLDRFTERVKRVKGPQVRREKTVWRRKKKNAKDALFVDDETAEVLEESSDESDHGGGRSSVASVVAPVKDRHALRVVFATRTHSQLSQFVEEIRRTGFAARAVDVDLDKGHVLRDRDLPVSVVLFGSRKHMCVNDDVREKADVAERCRELADGSGGGTVRVGGKRTVAERKSRSKGCPFRNAETEALLTDRAVVQVQTVEELAQAGRDIIACPYYASRSALATSDVDIVGVPYSAVLHAPTRAALGLDIDHNTVIVFDEAHNVVNTVCDLHAAVLTRSALAATLAALISYTARYENRFAAGSLYSLRQLRAVAEGLMDVLPNEDCDSSLRPRVVAPSTLLFDARIDNINLYSLIAFMQSTNLSKKLRGFVDSDSHGTPPPGTATKAPSVSDFTTGISADRARFAKHGLSSFENFVASMADCPSYGRVAVYPSKRKSGVNDGVASSSFDAASRLKFFVVDPAALFASSMKGAQAVLLLGGTLSPRAAIKDRLLAHMTAHAVHEFECDHVVPAENMLTAVCGTGPTGVGLEFTHRTRQTWDVTDELGRALCALVGETKGGVVVFFSSYDYLARTMQRWTTTGQLATLSSIKPVFNETRGEGSVAFVEYQAAVSADTSRGGILGAVMGGRLSEGINFSDALGRLVVIVGMPFANAAEVETAELLRGMGSARERGEFLENACLTVVNQSIGRAVRHRRDYAAVVLMDKRYSRPRVVGKLPAFIRRGVRTNCSFVDVRNGLHTFFDRHKEASEFQQGALRSGELAG